MSNRKVVIFVIIVIVIGNLIGLGIEELKKIKLKQDIKTVKGLFNRNIKSAYSSDVAVFRYTVNGENYSIIIESKKKHLQKNDTVLIKYSIDDPSIAEVIDYCYMGKYKKNNFCK